MQNLKLLAAHISIHAPSRERRFAGKQFNVHADFNPRSLAGATIEVVLSLRCTDDFNPRSLAGATRIQLRPSVCKSISIHAPSRERPLTLPYTRSVIAISIHAPSRERPSATSFIRLATVFQSTLPRGSDLGFSNKFADDLEISIHAPSRERHHHPKRNDDDEEFQSTLPRGSDSTS